MLRANGVEIGDEDDLRWVITSCECHMTIIVMVIISLLTCSTTLHE